ncbi:FAD-binding oxidoreductase [Komagataeibacter xylinus]|uniref:FAD-binding oxidoreductase n=1 Tax=Komagataeibacter xylinus TaxID=28448 RepID=A0A857FLU6_KOMXY|nr:FAD-dependent oxidoreductase [Komagataeibacter xylinus]QHC35171.1 FAD-binding oxidoreductase [Komagataeibacter xylinus]
MKIVIIGAGAIGANCAFRMAQKGAEVVVLEAVVPGSGTSATSAAWLSSFPQFGWTESPGRARLRRTVHARFAALQAELGGDWLHWDGTLTWGLPSERADFRKAFHLCKDRGADLQFLDASAARRLVPGVMFGDDDEIVRDEQSGWVDAASMIAALLTGTRALGGIVDTRNAVTGIRRAGGHVTGVTLADGEHVTADVIINAAGSWGSHVAAMAGVGIPLELVPGLVVFTQPTPSPVLSTVLNAPTFVVRPDPSGGVAIIWRGEKLTSIHGRNGSDVGVIMKDVARVIPALSNVGIADARMGVRAIPPGGPVIGALPWLDNFYCAVSHGGIGWGPCWADLLAAEILDGRSSPDMADFLPQRFYHEPMEIGRFADDAEQVCNS